MDKSIEVIAVLGGGFKKDAGGWRTTDFDDDGDKFGILGDRLRVVAGACLYQDLVGANSDILIVASGGRGQYRDVSDSPTISSILKKELIELGIPEKAILEEDYSNNTYSQLKEFHKIIFKNNFHSVALISNQWHLPRIRAMIEYGKELSGLKSMLSKGDIKILSAEELLLDYQPTQWKDVIKKFYESSMAKKRIDLEGEGVRQIRAGSYKLI